jgi:hypothetical protein
MRKIAAILLMCLLLFNWYGYKFVTYYLQEKADTQLQARIDVNDYDESQLIEIKVALNMPYQNNQTGFERQYGEIQLGGKIYTYVKRKVEDGYLILKCLPNTAKQNIKTVDNILFNINNGIDQEHSGSKNNSPLSSVVKNIFSDYDDYSFNYNLNNFLTSQKQFLLSESSFLYSISLPVAEQPPKVFSVSLS